MDRQPFTIAVAGLLAMAAALGIGRFVLTPILPVTASAEGWNAAQAGLVASANYLGYLAGALATAAGLFTTNLRKSLLAALLVSGASTAAMALGDTPLVAGAARFVGGWASAVVIVAASTLVLQRLQAARRSSLSAVHFAGVGFGITISAIAVSVLSWAGAGWQAMWLVSGALALAALPVVARGVSADVPTKGQATVAATLPSSNRPLHLMTAAYGLFGFGYIITATFIVAIVRRDPALQSLEPWVWIVVGLTAMPSVAAWTRLGERFGVMAAYAGASLFLAAGVAASVEAGSPAGILLAAAILGGGFMGLTALGLIAARQLAVGAPQRAIGQMTACFAAGQTVGPALAGYMADQLGSFRAPSLLAAAMLVLAAALSLWAARILNAKSRGSVCSPGRDGA
jgi:predicted MFS family arabinose efflux permease